MPTVVQLQEQRAEQAKAMKDLHAKAEAEDRGFTPEEKTDWDNRMGHIADFDERIKKQEFLDTQRAKEALSDEGGDDDERRKREWKGPEEERPLTTHERSCAMRYWAASKIGYRGVERDAEIFQRSGLKSKLNDSGRAQLDMVWHRGYTESGEEVQAPRTAAEVDEQIRMRRSQSAEKRATQIVGTTTLGGFLVPDEMMAPLEKSLLAFGGVRRVATIRSTSTGADLPWPSMNDTTIKGEIIAEDNAVNEQAITFASRTLKAFKYSSKMIPISVELLQDSATNMPALIGEVVGERIGRITNDHFTTGTGTTLPFGVVTDAGDSGVTLAAAQPTWQEMVDVQHSVDVAYRERGATWMMHDLKWATVKKIADSQNRPIYLPSVVPGAPDMLLGSPVVINNSMASSGSSAKTILYGDFSKYIIREVKGITLLRLDERYAEYHRVAFLAFARYDGKLIDAGTDPIKWADDPA